MPRVHYLPSPASLSAGLASINARDKIEAFFVADDFAKTIVGGNGEDLAPTWDTVPTITFVLGSASNASIASYAHDPESEALAITKNAAALPSGVIYSSGQKRFEYDGTGSADGTNGHVLTAEDGVDATVASFTLTSAVGGADLPFTLGHAFKEGDVSSSYHLGSSLADFQCDVRSTWPDGSIKFAVLSGRATLSAGTPLAVDLERTGTAPTGANLTEADLIAASPTVTMQCGAIGTVSLASLLGTTAGTADAEGLVRSFLGPVMSEFHYRGKVGSDTHLRVYFHVRFYKGGAIETETIVENGFAKVSGATAKSYVPTLTVAGSSRYTNGGAALSHLHHTRWAVPFWHGTDPQITPQHDVAYARASRQVPNYGSVTLTNGFLNGLTQSIVPFQGAGYHEPMDDTGFAPSIGLLPNWDAAYWVGGDARAYRSVIANGYAAGRYCTHWRDETTGRPIRFSQFGAWSIPSGIGVRDVGESSNTLPTPSGTTPPLYDMPHHPSMGYSAYLVTGRWYFMEELQFVAAINFLKQSENTRNGTQGVFAATAGASTCRGVAWALRTLAACASATADADSTMKAEYVASLGSNAAYYDSNYTDQNAIFCILDYNNYTEGTGKQSESTWQQDFLSQAMGFGRDLKLLAGAALADWNAFLDWHYGWQVGRLGASGYCYLDAAIYYLTIADTESFANVAAFNAAVYADWPTVWNVNVGSGSCPANGELRGESGADPAAAGTGYWGNLLPAISYAVDHGAAGAAAAYARMTSASNWASVALPSFADLPVWYVLPRSA